MRGHTTGAGILLGLATAIMTAPIAFAQDETPFLAAPGELLQPGNELHIQGYCPDPDAGPLTSPALTSIEVLHDPASGPPNLTASGVVAEGTEPGSYPVTMECLGETLQVVFTVINAETPATPPATPAPSATAGDGRPQPADEQAAGVSLTLQPTTVRPGDRGDRHRGVRGVRHRHPHLARVAHRRADERSRRASALGHPRRDHGRQRRGSGHLRGRAAVRNAAGDSRAHRPLRRGAGHPRPGGRTGDGRSRPAASRRCPARRRAARRCGARRGGGIAARPWAR